MSIPNQLWHGSEPNTTPKMQRPQQQDPRAKQDQPQTAALRPVGIRKKPLPCPNGLFEQMIIGVIKTEAGSYKLPMYKKLACFYSSKIRAYCREYPTATTVPLLLGASPELRDPYIFEFFVQYLNLRNFAYIPDVIAIRNGGVRDPNFDRYKPLVLVYQFAQELGTTPLQNLAIAKMREISDYALSKGHVKIILPKTINYIYTTTNRGSLLRKLAVDQWAFHGDKDKLFGKAKAVEVCADFTVDLSKRVMDLRDEPDTPEPPKEVYYLEEVSDNEEGEDDGDDVVLVESRPVTHVQTEEETERAGDTCESSEGLFVPESPARHHRNRPKKVWAVRRVRKHRGSPDPLGD